MNSLLYLKGIELPVKGKKLLALINRELCAFGVAIPFTKPFTKPQCRIKKNCFARNHLHIMVESTVPNCRVSWDCNSYLL